MITRNNTIAIKRYVMCRIARNLNVLKKGGKKGFYEYISQDKSTSLSYTNITRLCRNADGSWVSVPRLFRLYTASVAFSNGLPYDKVSFYGNEFYDRIASLSEAKLIVSEIDLTIV